MVLALPNSAWPASIWVCTQAVKVLAVIQRKRTNIVYKSWGCVALRTRTPDTAVETIEKINPNVRETTRTTSRMTWVMDQRIINNGMDRVGDKLSPPGMMLPFNW